MLVKQARPKTLNGDVADVRFRGVKSEEIRDRGRVNERDRRIVVRKSVVDLILSII